jgi:nuclear pore complex protein Nup88
VLPPPFLKRRAPTLLHKHDADSYGAVVRGGEALILVADLREELAAAGASAAELSAAASAPSALLRPSPAVTFTVEALVPSRDGRYLLLTGRDEADDERPAVALLDVYGGHPEAAAAGASGAASGASGAPPARRCALHFADYRLFQARPGLRVLQAAWHPHSASHFGVLTSDSKWRLYGTQALEVAEQTLSLRLNAGGAARVGAPSGGVVSAVAFAFGPPVGWGLFTLFVLASHGGVMAVCPVAPFGMQAPASVVDALAAEPDGSGGLTTAWLHAAFGTEALLAEAAAEAAACTGARARALC